MTSVAEPRKTPAIPELAACVVLIRDAEMRANGSRLEVLMTERHGGLEVAGGALVFPGGKVDNADSLPEICRGLARGEDFAFRICAIREAFEETGIVLARDQQGGGAGGEIQDRLVAHIHDLDAPGRFCALLQGEGLEPAPDALLPLAHWITPAIRPRRFDTRFYLAAMPAGQQVIHDGAEAVEAFWAAPEEVIDRHAHDISVLMFPTRMTLGMLCGARDVAEAMERIRRHKPVPIEPRLEKREDGIYAHVPPQAGFGGSVFPFQLNLRIAGMDMLRPVDNAGAPQKT